MIFHFEHGALPGSLELAYLGDTLYDLYVREHLITARRSPWSAPMPRARR